MRSLWLALAALLALGCTDDARFSAEDAAVSPDATALAVAPLTCAAGTADCDGERANGCEADLAAPSHCGACGNACEEGGRCVAGACLPACEPGYGDCYNTGFCDDLSGASANCGRCGNRCPVFPGVGSRCINGQCVLRCVLTSPFRDCDGDPATGCEHDTSADPSHCGGCGNVCAAGWRCINGDCIAPCPPGTGECLAPGQCFDLATTPWACGACGHRCESRPNAESTCVDGVCGFRCYAQYGYGDCDGDPANGCEVHLPSSSAHCGACGNACPGGGACIDRVCHPPCSATYRDCVSNDGLCETDTLTSPEHCGACGAYCIGAYANGHLVCAVGTCERTCDPGFADCDGAPANGCEVDLSTNDGAHCGACGRRCTTGEACVSGVCSLPAPRQWRPQSVSITTTRRPTFAWHLPAGVDGARLEVCADRACTRVEHTADVTGESYRPPESVVFNEGVHYWRLWGRSGGRLATAHGPTWLFRAPAADAMYDTAWAIIHDVDGDGVEDSFTGTGADRSLVLSTGTRTSLPMYDGFPPFQAEFHTVFPWLSTRTQFAGDLDGDGYGDLVAVASAAYNVRAGETWSNHQVVFVRGRDLGVPSPRWSPLNGHIWRYEHGEDWTPPSVQPPIGDLDGDGLADLGGGRFTEVVSTFGLIWLSTNHHEDLMLGRWVVAAAGDVDGDGRSEAITVHVYCGPIASNACVSTYGRGMGAPLPLTGACAAAIGGADPGLSIDDFNADGLADLQVDYRIPLTGASPRLRFLGGPGGLTGDRCELVP